MRTPQRRLFLVTAIVVAAVCDVLLLAANPSRSRRSENAVWFVVEGEYGRPRNQVEAESRVLILRRGRRWLDASGVPVSHLGQHVRSSSALIIRKFSGSFPPIVAIPVFVSLGSEASIRDFTDTLERLRLEDICWLGFEELAQPDRLASGEPVELIPTLKIC